MDSLFSDFSTGQEMLPCVSSFSADEFAVSSSDILPLPSVDLPLAIADQSLLGSDSSVTSSPGHSPSPSIDVSSPISYDTSEGEWGDDTSFGSFEEVKVPPITPTATSSDAFVLYSNGAPSFSGVPSSSRFNASMALNSPTFTVINKLASVPPPNRLSRGVSVTTTVPAPAKRIPEAKAQFKKDGSRKRARKTTPSTTVKQEAYNSGDEGGDGLTKRDRNKLSAAKYRKRRKMYMETLETKVHGLEKRVTGQSEKIKSLETENSMMREQLAFFRNLLSKSDPSALKPNNPKATAVMFVLFACLLMCTGHWQAATVNSMVSSIDDPSITSANTGRRLLNIDSDSTATATDEASLAVKVEGDVQMRDAKACSSVFHADGKLSMPALEVCNQSTSTAMRPEDQKAAASFTPEEKFVMGLFSDAPAAGAIAETKNLTTGSVQNVVVKFEPPTLVPEGVLAVADRMS